MLGAAPRTWYRVVLVIAAAVAVVTPAAGYAGPHQARLARGFFGSGIGRVVTPGTGGARVIGVVWLVPGRSLAAIHVASADTQRPTRPTALAVASAGQTIVVLAWVASTDNVGVAGYGVYENGSLVASSATTGYTLVGLICGTAYTVAVDAYDAAGNRSEKATIVASSAACPGLASVYVSTSGNDSTCVRGDASRPCATPGKACAIAQGGDTILVGAGVYAAGFNVANCNPVSAVTFENAPGANVFFAGDSTIGPSVSNIAIQGDRIGHGVGFSLGRTAVTGSSNIVWNNVNLYCQNASPWTQLHSNLTNEDSCSSALTIAGATNGFTWNGGDQSDWASCLTNCTHTGTQGNPNVDAIGPGVQNVLIEHVNTSNYFSLDNNGSAGDHSEAWIFTGGSHVAFLDDSWTRCEPPVSTGYALNNSCNTAYLFFGQSGSSATADNYTFTQDIIAPGHGQKAFQYGYNAPAGHQATFAFLYNDIEGMTICGASTAGPCGPNPGNTFTGTNMLFVGNVAAHSWYGNCFSAATYSHNIFYTNNTSNAGGCGPNDINGGTNVPETKFWVSPNGPNYNYTPTPLLYGAGETASCPAADINGNARPTATPCDAGAVQH